MRYTGIKRPARPRVRGLFVIESDPKSMRRRLCAATVAVMVMASSSVVCAQAPAAHDAASPVNKPAKPSKAQLDLNDHGVENIVAGNYARAVAQLEEAVLRGGEFNIIYLNLGRAYQKLGNCAKARDALAKAKSAQPVDDPPAELVDKKADQYLSELGQVCPQDQQTADNHIVANGQGGADPQANDHTGVSNDGQAPPSGDVTTTTPAPAPASVRAQNPNLIYLEFAGHGLVPTANYERFLWQGASVIGLKFDASIGAGLGFLNQAISWGASSHKLKGMAAPVFATATFFGERHSMYGQAGVTFFDASVDSGDKAFLGLPFVQIGYQFQGTSGFILRASGTVMPIAGGTLGLSAGWSF